ncbi:MAG: pyrroline-5-carboxylate reductase [Gammaproteobacteria bacterium]|nr:pyrroline-5-carboxylate reductase [Gammaproteobacteria bacterium]
MNNNISFIGGGNMARSLISGLKQGGYRSEQIRVCDPDPIQRERLQQSFGIVATDQMADVIDGADCVVLAVKPQVLSSVCIELGPLIANKKPLLLSIAAGVKAASINRWLGDKHAIVRCMPNTPALIQAGASALYANSATSESQCDLAESIMRSTGIALWVSDEKLMDAVTALSGSGPAYIFLVIEAMQTAGEKLGLPAQQSKLLALQTVLGAAKMAMEDSEPVWDLRARVTSKGGTTEKALETFEKGNLLKLFTDAMTAAYDRSVELAQQLDQSEAP